MCALLPSVTSSPASDPRQVPGFWLRVAEMEADLRRLWLQTEDGEVVLGNRTGRLWRYSNARHTRRLLDWLSDRVVELPAEESERCHWRQRVKERIQAFGEERLSWPQEYRDLVISEEFYEASVHFVRRARQFDPRLTGTEVGQALRNVWIVNSLQTLLDRRVVVTPAVFAYSMLYPYTDNYLDDPEIDPARKSSLNDHLTAWLSGREMPPADGHQAEVLRLVDMIEGEFSRSEHPEVYASLQAIHRGQRESLLQHQRQPLLTERQILAISVRKGGSSVLADGYLVAGTLAPPDREFCMGYGAFLQLLDDLQDVRSDLQAGHQTLFTRAAQGGSLDRPTARLYHFMHRVIERSERLQQNRHSAERDLILHNCVALLVGAVAENPRLFSRRFRRGLERCWPVSLRAMRRLQQRAVQRFRRSSERLCQSHGIDSVLDLL